MLRYICRRVVGVTPVLIIVVTFVSFLTRLTPGDPTRQVAGPQAAKEDVEPIGGQLGLSRPLPQQYVGYVTGLVRGDLGTSLKTRHPVLAEVQGRYMSTMQLAFLSLTWSVIVGVLVSVWSGRNRSKQQDYVGMTVVVSGTSMPPFWIRFMLIMIFAAKRRLLPTTRAGPFKSPILPSIMLGVGVATIIARFTRSSVIKVMKKGYVHTARAKGLREKTVIWKYVFRNCMIPVVTVVGFQSGFFLGGFAVTEIVFAFPRLGSLLIGFASYRGYPAIQSLILVFFLHFVLTNLVVDVLHVVLNPEIQLS